ncbi:hypothetical protein TRFO_39062 [Tritrichomonas foetus]|uniref:Chromo domain-containing protein n=1 Tax=Tritrichomonas foetus TaxID=1144522 RepID=A0A1J4JBG3_9EUKA|nr:hypothetical protein TRFO_39062 [Tritrichomonas foetus]|eukprot:OHS94773.1 hypothetical protein TRFO_39062 [Tritrichomonas foetus]
MKNQELPDQVFEVERIVDARYTNGHWEFFIKWKCYPESSNSWEPEKNICSPYLVQNFWKTHRKEDYMIPTKRYFLPTNTLEISATDMKEVFDVQYPLIKDAKDIKEITGYKKGKDGLVYYYVTTTKYQIPILIPSNWVQSAAPDKLVYFFESHVKV